MTTVHDWFDNNTLWALLPVFTAVLGVVLLMDSEDEPMQAVCGGILIVLSICGGVTWLALAIILGP